MTKPLILPADRAGIAEAAALIARGLPVAVPSETVYGLAGDATSGEAVAAIYAAKGRPSFNPLIVHVTDIAMAERVAILSALARRMAAHFWPGPLTMVLPIAPGSPVASLATAGLSTVAVRMPSHPAIRALIAASGRPLAAPSANASGSISATRADHVARSLAGRIPLVLDDGPTAVGIESTIVAVEDDRLRLLRPGSITIEMLSQASGVPVVAAGDTAIEAPGQMASHYAPSKPVRLGALAPRDGEYLIGFGAIAGDACLSPAGNLAEAAARLFDLLHAADQSAATAIAVAPIPADGLGLAINDRLRRAAAPR
ncbi:MULTISPECIES: L-threonylcarbamoyladenylate synthase [unclassified Sphingomonas]|uniref:L-threonylcarbamoyladenylate synthase n=1 Tax=unclassified Sphingomonas TaxID=196159 RepID=UPI0006FFD5F9|nr:MULTISPECIES: L-threonylcarbamoyladenylate synthase [unclassified Sphingomonas]KQX20189.1 translation factor Sua5 [Sphingomonas sp. Root1294]KQY67439.1 translation factor Sua5 [Sphingomonas sp. Root50]KRB90816.1 translation factor Sua5 [Sphingomonas sp. Root720]